MSNTEDFFDTIYHNTTTNAILIMDTNGIIAEVNNAFTAAYGYTTEDLSSKHLRLLFIEKDRILLKPEIELNITLRQGSGSDENYLVHKDGTPIWVTGESILINKESHPCIVKIIHNIHAQKQLERYLLGSNELLDSLFHSVRSGLLLLDAQMRIVKHNGPFLQLFGLESPVGVGSKLSDIEHSFWQEDDLKKDIRNSLITGERINKVYIDGDEKDGFRRLQVNVKLLMDDSGSEKRVLLIIDDQK